MFRVREEGLFQVITLFVSAEEIGDLYDNQEVPVASKSKGRAKFQKNRGFSGGRGGKRRPAPPRRKNSGPASKKRRH